MSEKIKIDQCIERTIYRKEANFDRACDEVFNHALMILEIDEYGHSDKVEEWDRSSCSIEIQFVKYTRFNHEHNYVFNIIPRKNRDEY